MARIEGQKLKILVLADILARETDSAHGLTVPQLIEALAARGIPAERKSIYTDLRALEDFGLDVICLREGHICRWALASRTFEVAELKLLVDAVQSSKFLSEKKSRALIKKLESLCSRHEAKALQRQVFVTNRPKSMNESIYYTIDLLHTAISTDEQVRFQIAEWTPEKTVRYRRGGKLYTVSPYALIWEDENYYLLAYDPEAGAMRHYRADRLAHLALAGGPRVGKEVFARLDMAAYTKRTFGMFGGEETGVTLEFAVHLAGVVIDRFGKDVTFFPAGDGRFRVYVHVVPSVQFMGWLAGLGAEARLISPPEVQKAFCAHCRQVLQQYGAVK